jgi:hypothetical protein
VVITDPDNTAVGEFALVNSIGIGNTATGFTALNANTGNYNTANGSSALQNNTTGAGNTAIGYEALIANTTGVSNTATGFSALPSNTGSYNTANGSAALQNNTTGFGNTATGYSALAANSTASWNTATGYQALAATRTGASNTANGNGALRWNVTGDVNVALGYLAGVNQINGSNNVYIGGFAGSNQTDGSNNVYIGYGMAGVNGENNSCYISSIFGQTSSGGTPVFINSEGKLGTTTSSRRFKEDIKPMDNASEALFALKPVTFRYKKEIDRNALPQFGLIAEDVADVNPQLVVRDKEGKVNTVRYEQINAMLLNEFLKEHKKVEEQQVTISDLKKDVGVLSGQLKEQAAEIQKVSAELEMRRPLTRVARTYP